MSHPDLKNPPVVESVLFIRFKDKISRDTIISFCDGEYAQKAYEIDNPSFQHKDVGSAPSVSEQTGRVLTSKPRGKVLRVNLDSVSFHSLKYTPFGNLFDEFNSIVEELLTYTQELSIDRVSLRYINLIKIDSKGEEIIHDSEYVNMYVQSPFTVHNYFLQINVSDEEGSESTGTITQTLKPVAGSSTLEGIVVDIKVQKDTLFSYSTNISKDHFFSLREYKNRLFFSTIKPEILETYK